MRLKTIKMLIRDRQADEHPGWTAFLADLPGDITHVDIAWMWFKQGWSAHKRDDERRRISSVLSND